jgi:hypothetical protein
MDASQAKPALDASAALRGGTDIDGLLPAGVADAPQRGRELRDFVENAAIAMHWVSRGMRASERELRTVPYRDSELVRCSSGSDGDNSAGGEPVYSQTIAPARIHEPRSDFKDDARERSRLKRQLLVFIFCFSYQSRGRAHQFQISASLSFR